jgi:hypothetical protein
LAVDDRNRLLHLRHMSNTITPAAPTASHIARAIREVSAGHQFGDIYWACGWIKSLFGDLPEALLNETLNTLGYYVEDNQIKKNDLRKEIDSARRCLNRNVEIRTLANQARPVWIQSANKAQLMIDACLEDIAMFEAELAALEA